MNPRCHDLICDRVKLVVCNRYSTSKLDIFDSRPPITKPEVVSQHFRFRYRDTSVWWPSLLRSYIVNISYHHIISYHIISYRPMVDLKRQTRLKVGTNKPKLQVKMQSVWWFPGKTSWKATFWAGSERCIQTGKMLEDVIFWNGVPDLRASNWESMATL